MRPTLIILLLSGWLGTGTAAPSLWDGDHSLSVSYRSSYDSNILRYSSSDRDRFENLTEISSSPITTLDDVRSDVKLSASYTIDVLPKLQSRVTLTGDFAAYTRNGIKNLGWLSLSVYQDVTQSVRVSGNYFYEPYFFLRVYKDINTKSYHPCDYGTSQGKGVLRYRWRINKKGTWIDLTGSTKFKRYAYNGYFTEYDSDVWEFGGEAVFRTPMWRIGSGYTLSRNDNVGFRTTEVARGDLTQTDSELGESDYQEDNYDVSLRFSSEVAAHSYYLQLAAYIGDRYYTTKRDAYLDPMHSGRHDINRSTEFTLNFSLNEEIDIAAGLEYASRNSTATAPVVARVKDNKHWTSWVEVNYQIW